jgi:hypothetical protein
MATFTVHVPPGIADPLLRAERTVFVRDGFSLPAFLFGPVYLLYRRLWLAACAWVAAAVLIGLVVHELDLPGLAGALLVLLICLLTGLEAHETRRNGLNRRGYLLAMLLAGVSRAEGERLFFSAGPPRMPTPRGGPPAPGGEGAGDIIGLFPQPGTLS